MWSRSLNKVALIVTYVLLTGGERLVSSVQILIMIALISGQHSLHSPFGAFNMQLNTDSYRHDILMKRPSGYSKLLFERKKKQGQTFSKCISSTWSQLVVLLSRYYDSRAYIKRHPAAPLQGRSHASPLSVRAGTAKVSGPLRSTSYVSSMW